MKKILFALIVIFVFSSHDLYLKMDTYFMQPNTSATINLFNGTFDKSENVIDLDRMTDASLLGNGIRAKIDDTQWSEEDSITVLKFKTGESGTWVAGVSTAPRTIEMAATDFNDYLEHDGVLDVLAQRRKNDELENDATEKYSKHVKAIFQVGDKKTSDWQTELGYPIEFIPLNNPYEAHTGDILRVKLLLKGQPLADQLVYVDYKKTGDGHSHDQGGKDNTEHDHDHDTVETAPTEHAHTHGEKQENSAEHSHDRDEVGAKTTEHEHENEEAHRHEKDHENGVKHSHDHDAAEGKNAAHEHENDDTIEHGHSHAKDQENGAGHSHEQNSDEAGKDAPHTSGSELRTDSNGIINVKLKADGIWYLRTINLVKVDAPELTHESNWATLTFEVTHGHGEDSHSHTDEDEGNIPSYVFWIGSFIVLGGLFFWFNRKK